MKWLLLSLVGLVAGFVNTMAGSGSLLSLPMLMYMGLPPEVANGTNRVGVLLQNVTAVTTYHRRGALPLGRLLWPTVMAVLGSLVGAWVAVILTGEQFKQALGYVMLAMVVVMLIKPEHWVRERPEGIRRFSLVQAVAYFLVGIYGGFVQGGVGVFLLAALVLGSGFELVRANAVKNWIVLWFTAFSLIIFVLADQVWWITGLVLSLGNVLGAWLAAHLSLKKGAGLVHGFLVFVVLLSAADFLGLFRWLF